MSAQAWPTDADVTTCEGAEVIYSIEDTVVDAVSGTAIYPSGMALGAVVVIIGTDGHPHYHEVHAEPPDGRTPVQALDTAIRLLREVRDALRRAEQVAT